MTQTVETMTESVPVTSAQVERLLEKKGEVLRRLQKEQKCLLELRRKEGVVLLTAPEESRAAAKAALETVLASVCVETTHLARRQVPLFVGPQELSTWSFASRRGRSGNDAQHAIVWFPKEIESLYTRLHVLFVGCENKPMKCPVFCNIQ